MERVRHLSKAQHNKEFFESFDINKTKFRDWVVVGVFYTAIHYYEAYFANFGKHSRSHEISDDWILNDKGIEETYDDYRELKQYRWYASYRNKNFTPQEITNSIVPKLQNILTKLQS